MTEQTVPVIPQDGILPERDAQNNSEEAQRMREAVEEQWQLEYPPVDKTRAPLFLPELRVFYADDHMERVMPLAQAHFMAVDAYMKDLPFTVWLLPQEQDASEGPEAGCGPLTILVHYDCDVIRSEFDRAWARDWIAAGVAALQELIQLATPRTFARDSAGSPDDAGEGPSGTDDART